MDWQKVKQWLDKYYEGDCSQEEEQQLKQALQRQDVPGDLEADKLMFSDMEAYSSTSEPGFDVEATINAAIDRAEKDNRFLSRPATQWFLRIAAVFVIAAGGYFVFQQQNSRMVYEKNFPADTYENPELAYLEAKRALLYISDKLNTGTDELQNLGKFSEGFENLSKLGAFDKATKLVTDEQEESKN